MTQSTVQSTARRPAPFRSAGAATHSPEDTSQEVSALLRAADNLQQVRNESDQLVRMALDDGELLAMAREIALSQGEELDEQRLADALDQVKQQRFRFQPTTSQGMGLLVANAWITRAEWGPKWRLGGLAIGTTLALATGGVLFVGQVRETNWMNSIEDSVASETSLRQSIEAEIKRIQPDASAPAAVASQISKARGALASSAAQLSQIAAVPSTNALREALYEQDPRAARALLADRHIDLFKVQALHQEATAAMGQASALRIAYSEGALFNEPIPGALEGLRDRQQVAFQAAAQRGDAQGMQQATQTLVQAIGLMKVRDAIATQTGNLSEKSRETIGQRLANATTAIAAGEIKQGENHLNETQNLLSQASVGYRLQIVSEAGVQTGVWRYYDNNRNVKSYYIVVDAIGTDGNPVELPITSVENKKTENVSRFAVRVPENIYNQIAKDKSEDGIVDQDLMAEKAVGELEPTYAFPVEGGAITRW